MSSIHVATVTSYSHERLMSGLGLKQQGTTHQTYIPAQGGTQASGSPAVPFQAVQEGGRNAALTSLAGVLRRRGLDQALIRTILLTQNQVACVPPLPESEVGRIAESVARYAPDQGETILPTLTDAGNADRVAADWHDHIRYVPEWSKWLIWDGKRWTADATAQIMELAKESARRIYEEGVALTDDKLRVAVARHGAKSLQLPRLEAMITLAESIPALVVPVSQLDADPMLLGMRNGVLDLRTGELHAARREDFLTKQAPVEFDADATCPIFEDFLQTIMGGSKPLVDYIQRVIGYSLTGSTTEQCLFFCYGSGANGKTTLLNVFKDLLGPDYCKQTDSDTLMAKKQGRGATNDLARLHGARVVLSNEVEEGSRLSEALIKQMTGGDPVSARFLFKEFFEFVPQFKLLVAGNHQPVIRGDDTGIWRRLQLVPFTVTIPPEQRDPDLPKKLRAELPGILNFALMGCLSWQQSGLQPPSAVTDAVQEYRNDMDILGQWIQEKCDVSLSLESGAGQLYPDYRTWSDLGGFHTLSKSAFGRRLKERNFHKKHTNKGVVYQGLALKRS